MPGTTRIQVQQAHVGPDDRPTAVMVDFPSSKHPHQHTKGNGADDISPTNKDNTNTLETIPIPTEHQLVLLCLDYLRDLRRSYPGDEVMREAEGLHPEYINLAIYALSRSFVSPSVTSHGQNDAWFDASLLSDSSTRKRKQDMAEDPSLFAIPKDLPITLPSIEDMSREVIYWRNPHSTTTSLPPSDEEKGNSEEKKQDEDYIADEEERYSWYEYDDGHPSNANRMYPLQGLASGPSLKGPLTLGDVAAAGLAALHARSRAEAEQEMVTSPLFEQFVQAVKSKGFFKDSENDVPKSDPKEEEERLRRSQLVYEERYAKVVSKFRTKLATKAQAGTPTSAAAGQMWALSTTERQRQRRLNNQGKAQNVKPRVIDHTERPNKNLDVNSLPHPGPSFASPTAADDISCNPLDVEEAERLKSQGNAHMQRKEYADAAASYTQALRLSPSGPQSHVYYSNRAAALLSMKKFQEAILDSERALALKPSYGKAHARLGLAHFLLGDYRQALEAYTVALKYEPDNKSSRSYLEKAAKRLAAAGEPVGSSSTQNAPDTNTQGLLVTSFSVVSEWDKSEKGRKSQMALDDVEERHAAVDQREAERFKVRGNAFMAHKDYRAALDAYSEALELCPDGPQSHVYYSNRAAALCYLERYHEAEQDSEKALSLKPTYGKAHARLGLSRFFLQDYAGAVQAYTSALQYDPDNAASKSYLAKAKLKLEKQGATKHSAEADARRLLDDPQMQKMAKLALAKDADSTKLMHDPETHKIAKKALSDPTMMQAVMAVQRNVGTHKT